MDMGGRDGDAKKAMPKRIVVKIKPRIKKNRKLKPTRNAPAASFGLPTFQIRSKLSKADLKNSEIVGRNEDAAKDKQNEDPSSFFPHNNESEEDIPSDTLMAISSLIRSDRGLHIPTTNNGSIQVILESQIYSIFDESHASTVNTELLQLIQNNKVKRMYCQNMTTIAYILTEDYVKAVWDAFRNDEAHSRPVTTGSSGRLGEEIIPWFLAQLHQWTNLSISESSLEERWEMSNNAKKDTASGLESKDVVRYLLNAQFLIRNPQQCFTHTAGREDSYYLWLPKWGIVLKAWNEARKQLLSLLAQQKEISKANVLRKNRHSCISSTFLLDELKSREKIRLVERPFGTFVQLMKDTAI